MPSYTYPTDGRLHTRYSELVQCSIDGVVGVVHRRLNNISLDNEALRFGNDRHELYAQESRKTGRTPKVFKHLLDLEVEFVERHMMAEIAPGIVLHSTLDAANGGLETIVDYKTAVCRDGDVNALFKRLTARYSATKQIPVYAYQAAIRDNRTKRGVILIEAWNEQGDKILGTHKVEIKLTLSDIAKMRHWLLNRANLLQYELNKQLQLGVPTNV